MGQPQYPNQPGQYPPPAQQYNPYPPQQPQPPQPDPWAQQAQPAAPQYANQGQQLAANNGLADPFANAGVGARIGGFKLGPNGHPIVNAALRNLGSGRIVVLVPKKLDFKQPNPFPESAEKKPFRDELIADLIVCTGEAFKFGGNNKDVPDTLGPVPVPCVIPDAFITNDGVIEKVPAERVGKGIVVGHLVLVKTSKGNYAWNLNEVPVSEYDKYGCRQAYEAYVAEQLPKAEGEQPLKVVQNAAPAPLPPAPQYAPPMTTQAPPQWPTMQPGQTMAPMQQAPVQQPVSAPVAPVDDWTLMDARVRQAMAPGGPLANYAQVWSTYQTTAREQILAQLGIASPFPMPQGAGYSAQGGPGY